MDVTIISPISSTGAPHAGSGDAIIQRAERVKARQYADLLRSPLATYATLAAETGGGFSKGCVDFVQNCVRAKTAHLDGTLQVIAKAAWTRRWRGLLLIALRVSVARSLADIATPATPEDDRIPTLGSLMTADPAFVAQSRMPSN